ncbi:hypothetical protein SNEBB_005328 [Seison nebaliae]|nr:hypothetical protein SNEBB_005328 [Seison nebaliae]
MTVPLQSKVSNEEIKKALGELNTLATKTKMEKLMLEEKIELSQREINAIKKQEDFMPQISSKSQIFTGFGHSYIPVKKEMIDRQLTKEKNNLSNLITSFKDQIVRVDARQKDTENYIREMLKNR